MQTYVIDIQSLYDRDHCLIPKEMTIMSLDNCFVNHWVIKSPHNIRDLSKGILNHNKQLIRNRHGLEWTDGESSLDKVEYYLHRLACTAKKIFVEGRANVNYLEKFMSCIIIDSTVTAPLISSMPENNSRCILHGVERHKKFSCSYNRAEKLKTWIKANENMYVDIDALYETCM